jgi:hypothetical protein
MQKASNRLMQRTDAKSTISICMNLPTTMRLMQEADDSGAQNA